MFPRAIVYLRNISINTLHKGDDDDDGDDDNNNNNTVCVDFKNKSDTRNNRGKWNHLKNTQKLSKNIHGMHV